MASVQTFLNRTALRLCRVALQDTRRILESRTLRRALSCRVEQTSPQITKAFLSVPHYWAVYYHDGRGAVKPRKGKFLVFFRNIEDDPRLGSATASPERAAQTKKLSLSPETFRRLREEGKLIVVPNKRRKAVGPAAGKPFFKPLAQFQTRAAPIVNRRFSRFVRETLRDAKLLQIRGTVTARI